MASSREAEALSRAYDPSRTLASSKVFHKEQTRKTNAKAARFKTEEEPTSGVGVWLRRREDKLLSQGELGGTSHRPRNGKPGNRIALADANVRGQPRTPASLNSANLRGPC
ncbi:hypothetical protein V5799_004604 [Amblyomma americanum]|uniref:Uncharacterized protein n=1 Tax=Amblyomma americanum TaxID=6943 RepID=A0AAQ4D5M6_AMBAM